MINSLWFGGNWQPEDPSVPEGQLVLAALQPAWVHSPGGGRCPGACGAVQGLGADTWKGLGARGTGSLPAWLGQGGAAEPGAECEPGKEVNPEAG